MRINCSHWRFSLDEGATRDYRDIKPEIHLTRPRKDRNQGELVAFMSLTGVILACWEEMRRYKPVFLPFELTSPLLVH